ncbi:MAG: class I SAM-dependent methyltransferase [Deferribacteres bacterium]|nr:class I SAM-dependent methyltransferase [Deferribacteres bacterium]
MRNTFNIDRIAFIGRTFAEYISLFDLCEKTLRHGPVLDCPAGSASFTAEAHKSGIDVTACDILFGSDVNSLIEKGRKDIQHIYEKVSEATHLFNWDYYGSIENLIALRESALDLFAGDFTDGYREGRYRYAKLPHLPFPGNHFSLVLSSHFLFLYSDRLGFDFHMECIKEFVRVCSGEIRIYPLTTLDARPCPYLNDIIVSLRSSGIDVEITRVPFEFQKGSGRMMKIICR